MYFVFSLCNFVLSIKLIYLELLISHFIRPVETAELPNVAHTLKSLETSGLCPFASISSYIVDCHSTLILGLHPEPITFSGPNLRGYVSHTYKHEDCYGYDVQERLCLQIA
jgi:hypothetical protein